MLEEKQNKTKEKNKKVKILSAKVDVVFQALFGEIGCENITKDLLEKILDRKIEDIDLSKNVILRRKIPKEKLGVLDVLAQIDNRENINIEMQVVDKTDMIERILYYWCKLYSKEIKEGEKYQKLPKTVIILITDYNVKGLEKLKYHTTWRIKEIEENITLTNKLEIHIIELPKIKGLEKEQDELLDWLYFINDSNCERGRNSMSKNKYIREAAEKLNKMSEDEEMQRIAELREKAVKDEMAVYDRGLEIGLEEGKKQGKEEGIKQGKEEGIKQGKEEGIREGKIENAKKMIEKGFNIKDIIEITELSKEEIENMI